MFYLPSNLFPVSISEVANKVTSFISSAGKLPDKICDRNRISSKIFLRIIEHLLSVVCNNKMNKEKFTN